MTIEKRHNFELTSQSLHKIDYLLPRLKYSVMPSKIIRWLENFDKKDLPLIYDFLQVFEYITFTEMQYRLEDLLKSIYDELDETDKSFIIPYGKFGKSGTLVSYPLTHSPFYSELKKAKRVTIGKDLESVDIENYNCIILLDDFIGSGNTFCEEYINEGIKKWVDSRSIPPKVYVLSTIIMQKGKDKIEKTFKNIKVFAQERRKIFDDINSPLIAFGKTKNYRKLNDKYEAESNVSKNYLRGYKESESLLAFTHGTPNNTLPIFWWGKNWTPLFPRHSKARMDDAREFKKDVAFYIGICNRLKIDLFSLEEYTNASFENKVEAQRKYNNKLSHSIIALLKLKLENVQDYIISHILGLTDIELNEIYNLSKNKGLTDDLKNITPEGALYMKNLEKKISREKSRAPTDENLKPKELIYVPRTFKGLT